jgi:ppGpp synthetase/RelA/SpoT-type nucleotidyltranferase
VTDLEALRERFIRERQAYARLARSVRDRLVSEMRAREIPGEVTYRAKEVHSLVKKAALKGLTYEEIPDKAGVRVVYGYPVQLDELEQMIRDILVVAKREDKREGIEPHELRYLGVHYDVRFGKDDPDAPPNLGLDDQLCEVQLHTRQQSTWAAYSHELLYKVPQDPPREVRRSVHRLLALVELFDDQVDAAKGAIVNQPGYEVASLLERLERTFFRLTARTYDAELSRVVLDAVVPLYAEAGQSAGDQLDGFLGRAGAKLDELYATYAEDQRASPLLFQPEALLLFERLEEAPARLEAAWSAILPRELLVELADVWGQPID